MKKRWHKIFNEPSMSYNFLTHKYKIKKNNLNNIYGLEQIIYPTMSKKKIKNLFSFFCNKTAFKKNYSVLDFGSGNGALLLFLDKKYNIKNLISLEICNYLINFQKKNLSSKTRFIKSNPYTTNFLSKINNNSVDISFAQSVFQYFYSLKYTKEILHELMRITKKKLFIYDVKNITTKKKYISNQIKKYNLNKKIYAQRYKYAPIRFFKKMFFIDFIKKNYPNCKISIINNPIYAQDNKFGFSVIISKNN